MLTRTMTQSTLNDENEYKSLHQDFFIENYYNSIISRFFFYKDFELGNKYIKYHPPENSK
jgi:hypothetical protein